MANKELIFSDFFNFHGPLVHLMNDNGLKIQEHRKPRKGGHRRGHREGACFKITSKFVLFL